MTKVPHEIVAEVVRQQEAMGWPDQVPMYASCPVAGGKLMWWHYQDLDVGMCEQLVEYHTRRARLALQRWAVSQAKTSCRTAARHILYARLYRCRYIELTGKTDSTEADMPLPLY